METNTLMIEKLDRIIHYNSGDTLSSSARQNRSGESVVIESDYNNL